MWKMLIALYIDITIDLFQVKGKLFVIVPLQQLKLQTLSEDELPLLDAKARLF